MLETESALARKPISQLFDQLTVYYQNTKEERKQLAATSKESEEFTVLEEIELLTVDVRGYASQVKTQGGIRNAEEAVSRLQNMGFLDVTSLAE